MNRSTVVSHYHATSGRHRLIGFLIFILALFFGGVVRAELSEKVAREIMKSTVRVVALDDDDDGGHGTGFIISSEGHVATNRHVVEGASRYFVVYSEGDRVKIRSAEIVGLSATADLAILKCEPISGTAVSRLATAKLNIGQAVTAVGFPGAIDTTDSWATLDGVEMDGETGDGLITSEDAKSDFQPAAYPGAVAKLSTLDSVSVIFHSAKISPGNSGGPLIDVEGRVCGINTAFIPAEKAGSDYPISICVSELVTLARIHAIPFDVTSSKASSAKSLSTIHILLYVTVAAFAVVMFLMTQRKLRMVMIDAMSRAIRPQKQKQPAYTPRQAHGPAAVPAGHSREPIPSGAQSSMRLRGRDLQGLSFDIPFRGSDFLRHGGRLVIGRSNDLSQLVIAHDSVSRQHATLILNGSSVQLEDRNSGNGTKVNGRDIAVGAPPVMLNPSDKLTLGEVDLIFEIFH